ncbi:HAD family hydrolase [Qiania dongpingensis]|uniref:HAD family phosphatase n=1 Tax=Qiania dongpingensis TaxID=2763669 RepID=A0A7G9G4K6_9FIRM|nr:HAD family phosphatase [Qiania dongpingensis]QNM05738.1 HAD family phosphatase [Qiania dongpingensis]
MIQIPDSIKAVIFDLDGTLVDSMGMWKDIDIEFLGRFHIPLPEDLSDAVEGMSFSETAYYFKERFQIPMSLQEIKDCWNQMALYQYSHEVPLKPGVKAFLEYLKKRGIPMGIATSNSRELVTAVTDALNISEFFSVIAVGCQVAKGKPAPDIYLCVAESLGEKPEHCLVFEDVPAGILAGKRAGMTVWAVADGYSETVREEKKRLADGFIETYSEIDLSV